ncbi:hypothetical protein ABN584_09005 [Gloeocapsa sp. BRSZ]|uniref:hypothetical protein n=1 Tax=Gloeocapsa sp. PCC 7428 TaxID=1173026 RepID=UPI0002A5C87A|nr:hypothetical protein [Gloeocapsa sp. PCC 7428]AFZ33031.1 hypothetical protein Glo7428_4595 [Gloeocapsa sp. PCC 7428]
MFNLFLQVVQPITTPLCMVSVSSLLAVFLWSIAIATRDGIARLKQLHQVPCSRCAYFTGDYRLKCTVHPCKALTEDAINCLDYEPAANPPKCHPKACKCR